MVSLLNWFEIPVKDIERAVNFYGNVFGFHMHDADMGDGNKTVLLMNEDHQADGALIKGKGYEPSDKGAVIYFDCGDNLQGVLDKVSDSGGRVVEQKKVVGEGIGYSAFITDTEGNRIGLLSTN